MTEQQFIDGIRQRLAEYGKKPPHERFNDLVASGVINSDGRVNLIDADRAVVAVRYAPDHSRITHLRCLSSVDGVPGVTMIDLSREGLIRDMRQGQYVITAYRDDRDRPWRIGDDVHLTSRGFLTTNGDDVSQDDLGRLPEFNGVESRP